MYHGFHQRLGTEVAIKLLPIAAHAQSPGLVDRFQREAQLAARIRSEHLVGVLDVDEDVASGCHFIVMEFVRGCSASAWLDGVREPDDGGAPEAPALEICIAATKGLAAAHLEGVVHRDIKPDNILIPADDSGTLEPGKAKLADLGLARGEAAGKSLTVTHLAMGTPGYMAPEQAKDAKSAKKPADVLGMGATLYSLLAGRAPFGGESLGEALANTFQGTYPPLHDARPDVTAATAAVVERCLALEPADRFPDAPALLDALELCRAGLETGAGAAPDAALSRLAERPEQGKRVATPSLTAVAPAGPPPRSRRTLLVLVVVAILAVFAFGPVAGLFSGGGAEDATTWSDANWLLVDLERWDDASSEQRQAAAEHVAQRVDGFAFGRLETFSAGGQTHEVAIFSHEATGMEFTLVPVGRFLMGSPANEAGRLNDETRHRVMLTRPFLIARTEVTQSVWKQVMGAEASELPASDHPVAFVSWHAAADFCARAGLNFPTEAQWEYACRAGTTSRYATGDDEASLARAGWFKGNSGGTTQPVGRKIPNAFGLFDVHGNVWEWCSDWYGPYAPGHATDPTGAVTGSRRMLKGGTWYEHAGYARVAMRLRIGPGALKDDIGLRPVRPVPPD